MFPGVPIRRKTRLRTFSNIPKVLLFLRKIQRRQKNTCARKKELPNLSRIIIFSENDSLSKRETAKYSIISFNKLLELSEKAYEIDTGFFDKEVDKGIGKILQLSYTLQEPQELPRG